MRWISLSSGNYLLREGARVAEVYCLLHGGVGLTRGVQRLWSLKAPQVLGLEGYYAPEQESPYSAVADTQIRVAAYSASEIPGRLLSSESSGEMVLQSLGRQLGSWWTWLERDPDGQQVYYPAELLTFEPGQQVIQEGDQGQDIYRIVSSDLGLEVSKNEVRLNVLSRPGEFFGEMAAFLSQPRNATVRSIGHSVLEVYPFGTVSEAIAGHPELAQKIITSLARRLDEANQERSGLKDD